MEFSSIAGIVVLLQFVSAVKLVQTSTSYCEWNTCESWQYCCGENTCCSNIDATFYVYTFLCVSGALLLFCCILFYLCRFSWHFGHLIIESVCGNYNNLPRDLESSRTNLTTDEVPNDQPMYADPPPPYSEVMRDRK